MITFDSLYEDFNTTIASLLETGDKIINQIQSIHQSKKVKNLSKQAIGDTGDLAMAFKDKKPKKKTNNNDKYYNCHKLGHFGRNYFFSNRKLNRITQ